MKIFKIISNNLALFFLCGCTLSQDGKSSPVLSGPPTKNQSFTIPGLCLEMIWVGPGEFEMGSPTTEAGREINESLHKVTLTQGFWLSKYEITQAQWISLMGNNPSRFTHNLDLPVENVNWSDAVEFCKKLTEREVTAGRMPLMYEYRPPTEAQWEYACRAGTTGSYAGNLDCMAWYDNRLPDGNCGISSTALVGRKTANKWGFHDMHGNVWEWCSDNWGHCTTGDEVDPEYYSEEFSSSFSRTLRGGAWNESARFCRSAYRFKSRVGISNSLSCGLRLCLRIPKKKDVQIIHPCDTIGQRLDIKESSKALKKANTNADHKTDAP